MFVKVACKKSSNFIYHCHILIVIQKHNLPLKVLQNLFSSCKCMEKRPLVSEAHSTPQHVDKCKLLIMVNAMLSFSWLAAVPQCCLLLDLVQGCFPDKTKNERKLEPRESLHCKKLNFINMWRHLISLSWHVFGPALRLGSMRQLDPWTGEDDTNICFLRRVESY